MAKGTCPSCGFPDEELFRVSGPDAEVNELCAECLDEWKIDGIVYHCKQCDGYIIDENTEAPQEFCSGKCEVTFQRAHGQMMLGIA